MQALLSFDKAPPFAAPLRFFLTAPLFAVLAGFLLLWSGADALASRWLPAALAATHLITVGFMLQVMAGALIQILPVVAGANLAHPLPTARIVHGGLSAGCLVLAGAFLWSMPGAFILAAIVLGGTAGFFILATGRALWQVPSTSPTIRGLKLALVGLLGVVGLGIVLALALAKGWSLDMPLLADLHAGWGLGAWSGILLVAMAYVVVPMFQLTPAYPARLSWWFPPLVAAVFAVWTLAVFLDLAWLLRVAHAAAALAGLGFCGYTLRLQGQRRRARADATFRYWQLGLWSAAVAMAMLLLLAIRPSLTDWPGWAPLFGIICGVGGFMSFIVGMLYKIIPFLAWLHLQNAGQGRVPAPNMAKILPDRNSLWQMRTHFGSLALLVGAVVQPDLLARPAGVAFALANGWLAFNLYGAIRIYRRHGSEIALKLGGA